MIFYFIFFNFDYNGNGLNRIRIKDISAEFIICNEEFIPSQNYSNAKVKKSSKIVQRYRIQKNQKLDEKDSLISSNNNLMKLKINACKIQEFSKNYPYIEKFKIMKDILICKRKEDNSLKFQFDNFGDFEITKKSDHLSEYLNSYYEGKNKFSSSIYLIQFQSNDQINCNNRHRHIDRSRSNTVCKNNLNSFHNGIYQFKRNHSNHCLNNNFNCNLKNKNRKYKHYKRTDQYICQKCHCECKLVKEPTSNENIHEAVVDTTSEINDIPNPLIVFCNQNCENCIQKMKAYEEPKCKCESKIVEVCCDCCQTSSVSSSCSQGSQSSCNKYCSQNDENLSCSSSCKSYESTSGDNCCTCPCRCPQFPKPPPYCLNSTYRMNYYPKCIPSFRRYKECDNLRIPLC